MSKASVYLFHQINNLELPIITISTIEALIDNMYQPENRAGLFLRDVKPKIRHVKKYTRQLLSDRVIATTAREGVYRVLNQEPLTIQEMISLADPYVYVAFLSAMQRWGLTNRQPKKFIFARPNKVLVKLYKQNEKQREKNEFYVERETPIQLPISHHSLSRIIQGNSKSVHVIETRTPANTMWLGGEHTRISTLAATFVDMLYRPDMCGGMGHVVSVWENHILSKRKAVLKDLIAIVSKAESPILKVRAGYLLSERLKIQDPEIDLWKKFVARGGSRKLDPDKPYINFFSEEWMLSLNA